MLPELVVFPDEEQLAGDYIRDGLAGIGLPPQMQVGSKIPAVRPAELVVVILTGGRGRSDALISSRAQLTIDSRAATEGRARFIAERVRALVNAWPYQSAGIASVTELANPSNLPDPTTPGQARYTQSFVVHLTGTTL